MLIKRRRGWEIPESAATPESAYFNRRGLMKGAGAMLAAAAAASCGQSPSKAATPPAPGADPSAALYPVKRNPAYALDRALTAENVSTRYNNYYEFGTSKSIYDDAQNLPVRPWEIAVQGLVEKPFRIGIDDLLKIMPLEERLYRHRCVEAWAMAVPWSGFPMKAFVDYCKPLAGARIVEMHTFLNPAVAGGQNQFWWPWPYVEALTIEEAANELAFMVTGMYGKPVPRQDGAPLRLATPWKYGFKSVKAIVTVNFRTDRPKTFWEIAGPSEYGFWANVNPDVPHPRWSQATEELIGTGGVRVPTKIFNGYGEQVAGLYRNLQGEQLYR